MGSLLDLPGLPVTNSLGNSADGINNRGQVLGTTTPTLAESQLWLWSPISANSTTGTTTAIPLPGILNFALNDYGQVEAAEQIWTPSVANGTSGTVTLSSQLFQGEIYMNRFGQILVGPVPYVESQGWLFTPTSQQGGSGIFTSLTGLPGATSNAFTAINAVGTVVGGSCVGCGATTKGVNEGFEWTPNTPNGTSGTHFQIAAPAGFSYLGPTALNAQGDVVGIMLTPSYQVTPFLYTGGVVYDLTAVSSSLMGTDLVQLLCWNQLHRQLFGHA